MRPLLSLLLLTSSIVTAHASLLKPFQNARTFDPALYNHTQDNPSGGYPEITSFFLKATGSAKWNTMSSWNISFDATFLDTYSPMVTTHCVARGYETDCNDADFGGDVMARVQFDLGLNQDRSADLTMVWTPWGYPWKMPACWRQVNITKRFAPGDIFGPTPDDFGEGGMIWEYRGVDNFLPDEMSLSSSGC